MVIITGDDNWWFLIQYLDYIVWTVAESLKRKSNADDQEVAAIYDWCRSFVKCLLGSGPLCSNS